MSTTESNQGFDSTSSSDVAAAHPPAGAVIFGYVNGAFAWSSEDWAKFPDDRHCSIVEYIPGESIVNVDGDILDVESGYLAAGSPHRPDALSQAAQWSARARQAGRVPGAYSGRDAIGDLVTVMGEPTALFVGDWTGEEHQDAIPGETVIATQYASPSKPAPGEGHWDLSEIDNAAFDAWYGHNHPGAAGGPSEPAQGPSQTPTSQGGTFDMQIPVLSEQNPGPAKEDEHVRALQALLNLRVGSGLTTDGRFGPHTAGAVVSLEHAHGLTVDEGIAGPQVWGALLG